MSLKQWAIVALIIAALVAFNAYREHKEAEKEKDLFSCANGDPISCEEWKNE